MITDQDAVEKSYKRKPWAAALLSLLTFGLGHLYCGRPLFALLAYLLIHGAGYLGYFLIGYTEMTWLGLGLLTTELLAWLVGLPVHAALVAKQTPDRFKLRSYNRWYFYLAIFLCSVSYAVWVEPMFNSLEAYSMPVSSMENQIMEGDYLTADNSYYESSEPARGDVIVFIYPGDGVTKYVKRVAGLPGDTVEVINKQLYVNSVQVSDPPTVVYIDTTASGEQSIRPRRAGGKHSRDNFGPFVVPEESYFVMGDNRDNSADSRFWGPVPRKLVLGKVMVIHWSSDLSRVGLRF